MRKRAGIGNENDISCVSEKVKSRLPGKKIVHNSCRRFGIHGALTSHVLCWGVFLRHPVDPSNKSCQPKMVNPYYFPHVDFLRKFIRNSGAIENSRGISLEALGEGAVTDGLLGKVVLGEKIVTKGVLGGDAASSATGARGNEEGDVGDGKSADGYRGASDEDQVHEVTTVLVDVILVGGLGHIEADGRAGSGNLCRGKGGGGADEGGEESGALDHGCY